MFSNQRQASLCIVLNLGMWCHTSQDKFIKSCEKTYTEIDSKKHKIFGGYYARETMKTKLKWNQNLELI